MVINDREVKFFYSVDAYCKYNDWMVLHAKSSQASANVVLAVLMSEAYAAKEGEGAPKPLTADEVKALPLRDYFALMQEVNAQQKADMEVSVETKPQTKRKNAKTAET